MEDLGVPEQIQYIVKKGMHAHASMHACIYMLMHASIYRWTHTDAHTETHTDTDVRAPIHTQSLCYTSSYRYTFTSHKLQHMSTTS